MTNQLSDHEDHFMRIAHARPFTDSQLNIAQILARGLKGLPENDGSRDWMENVVGICLEAIAEAVQVELMTDFRAELQRLVHAYDEHGGKWHRGRWVLAASVVLRDAVEHARTALAQPEPEREAL
jgi:hypothetical protein